MQKNTLTKSQYGKLLAHIKTVLQTGRKRAEEAVAQQLVQSYWQVGQILLEANLSKNAGYRTSVLSDLTSDLGLAQRTMRRILRFRAVYDHLPPYKLNWSQYRQLITVGDAEARAYYEKLAQEKHLSEVALATAIKERRFLSESAIGSPKKKAATLPRPVNGLYAYKATVERVIDGDTLQLMIDAGFYGFTRQRIRLAQIDAPSLQLSEGKAAQRFVIDELAVAPFVALQTTHRDQHHRFVGHVFYQPEEEDWRKVYHNGWHLNQELLRKGLARRL